MWYIDNQNFTTESNFKFLFLFAVFLINLYNLKNIVLLPIPVRFYDNKNKILYTIVRQISNNYPALVFLLCLLGAILITTVLDYYNKQVIASVRRAKSAQDELFALKEFKSNQSEYVHKIIKEAVCGLQGIINHVDNTLYMLELIDYYNIVFVPWF
jgi:quinol-cytochrome oxidoreductase complex cytochrome b subunit